MQPRQKIVISIVSALFLAAIGAYAFLRPPSLQSNARRTLKESFISEISSSIVSPLWLKNELGHVHSPIGNDQLDPGCWFTENIILAQNGEWLVYKNGCHHSTHFPDLFLAQGSDGRWYYTSFHFCMRSMMELFQNQQPENLAAFVKSYYLKEFDGHSDDCLQLTCKTGDRPLK